MQGFNPVAFFIFDIVAYHMEKSSSRSKSEREGELSSDSLMIRLWLENASNNDGGASWYGRIIHVSGGESRYIKDVGGIVEYLIQFLDRMGARVSWGWRIKSWLIRQKSMRSRNKGTG